MTPSSRPPHRRSATGLRSGGDPPAPPENRLVGLWADLLSALQQGSPGIATSAEEMAGELPRELVAPVNRELRQRGCSFQVSLRKREPATPPSCSLAQAGADPLLRD